MKSVVMLATVHQYQVLGNDRNSRLEERLDYLISKFGAQIVMEEWSKKQQECVAKAFATKLVSTGLTSAPHQMNRSTALTPIPSIVPDMTALYSFLSSQAVTCFSTGWLQRWMSTDLSRIRKLGKIGWR